MTKPIALVIEDHEESADIFSITLRETGFETFIAEDGQTALQLLISQRPTLVVLDLHLPHVSGEEILYWMRQDAQMAQTWVIVATADVRKAKFIENAGDTFSIVLLKPISTGLLHSLASRISNYHLIPS